MKESQLRQIIREEIQRLIEYRVDEEIPYTIDKLKKIYSMGYGAVVIAKGGGYSDVIEFGPNMREASFVKKVLEKNNLDVVIRKAKQDLKYAIEPKLKSKGRKLFIRITEPPITKVKEEFNMKSSGLRQIIKKKLKSLRGVDRIKTKLIYAPETLTPQELTVGGSLNLQNTPITSLPEGLKVRGDLDLMNCKNLTSLPKGLTVKGYLNLVNTPITSIPKGLIVKGDLGLENCKNLTSLPEGLTVGGDVSLEDCTSLKKLPKGLTVGGDLSLYNTKITSLPEDLKVKDRLFIRDTSLATKTDEEIRDMIKPPGYINGKILR